MRPMEQQNLRRTVAEIMWQRGNDTDPAVKALLAWLALHEDERQYWCDRAEAAIAALRIPCARGRHDACHALKVLGERRDETVGEWREAFDDYRD